MASSMSSWGKFIYFLNELIKLSGFTKQNIKPRVQFYIELGTIYG